MQYALTWNGKVQKIRLPETIASGEWFPIEIDGKKLQASWHKDWGLFAIQDEKNVEHHLRLRMSQVQRFDGESDTEITLEAQERDQIHPLKASLSFDLPFQNQKATGSKDLSVRSQITGKVLKVLVSNGETVAAGQTLLTIEAMKMENRVFSAQAGKVQQVHVKEGDLIQTGKLLVNLVP